MCCSTEELENKMEQLVMDLSYMQREATDLAIDRLIRCAAGDFGNDTCTYFVGTARSKWHKLHGGREMASGAFNEISLSKVKVMKDGYLVRWIRWSDYLFQLEVRAWRHFGKRKREARRNTFCLI